MKNVLLVIAGLPNGGAENQIVKIYNLLNNKGYNCYLVIFNKRDKISNKFHFLKNSNKVISLEYDKNTKFLFFRILYSLNRIYSEKNIDTVFSFLNVANSFVKISKMLTRKKMKYFSSIRNDFKLQYTNKEKILEFILSPLVNTIFTNSFTSYKYLKDSYLFKNKIHYLPNIIDCSDYKYINKSQNDGKFRILCVGRLEKQKNYSFLIDVAKYLMHLDSDIHFSILGNGSLEKQLKSKVLKHGINNIVFHGEQIDIKQYFKSADLFFMPSLYEGISNAMIESIFYNTPVFISKNSNGSNIIKDDINGFVFEKYDVINVAEKIISIKNMRRDIIDSIIDNAKNKVKKDMNEKVVFNIIKEHI